MAEKRDYYEVLGIERSATNDEIKRAYRKLAKKYHPDANPGDTEAEAKFKEASEAYAILSDEQKRKNYDQFGHSAFEGGAGGYGGFNMDDFDFGDIFGSMFGGGFSGFGGGYSSRRDPNAPRQGADVRIRLSISFEDSVTGINKDIEIGYKDECDICHGSGAKDSSSKVTCDACGGRGQVVYTQNSIFGRVQSTQTCSKCGGKGTVIKDKCTHCHGTGYKKGTKKITVNIPAGIDNGQMIRVPAHGEPGENRGPRGDLLVEVVVARDPKFIRRGDDIFTSIYMSYPQAVLGGDIKIRTVDGEVLYTIKPGTQTDTKVRLRGKGMPNVHGGARGDHYVTLIVDIPKDITKEQQELLERFEKTLRK